MAQPTMATNRPVIAIAGATGHLGQYIVNAVLSPQFRPQFSQVIILSRSASSTSPQLAAWGKEGATIRKYEEDNLGASFADADVVVNAIGSKGHELKDRILQSLPNTNVKLYFPSEFGVDHTVHDFALGEWDYKKQHAKTAAETMKHVKICRVYCGLFLEDSIGYWFGFDTKQGKYESIGSANTPVSFTGLDDVGRTVARLSTMPPVTVPDEVRLAGDTVSMSNIATIMEKAGGTHINIVEEDLVKYKKRTVDEGAPRPAHYLRFLMGEGKINHSESGLGNMNELVNPGERFWKWKTMQDLARDTRGRPWTDH